VKKEEIGANGKILTESWDDTVKDRVFVTESNLASTKLLEIITSLINDKYRN